MHSTLWVVGAVIAGLESTIYEVNEADQLIVCVIQLADIERNVTVTLLAESQSAHRK